MASFTCITCHVAFSDADIQRAHYKSDWHRYNLKRKVVELPPVSAFTFDERVRQHRNTAVSKDTEGISGFFCKLCQKRFGTRNAFDNHKKSKKHRDFEEKYLDKVKIQIENVTTDSEKDNDTILNVQAKLDKAVGDAKLDIDQPKILQSKADEVSRQFKPGDNPRMRWFQEQATESDLWEDMEDGSDIEEMDSTSCTKDDDADMESLLSDTSSTSKQRLITPTECLICLKKSDDMELNVIHMSMKHGLFIPDIDYVINLEGLLLYLGKKVGVGNICLWCNETGKAFYSISSVQKHMKDKGHSKVFFTGEAALEYVDFYNFKTVDGDSNESEEEDESKYNIYDDGEMESQDTELVLPSGATVGHRSLYKYYKQNFPTVQRYGKLSKKRKTLARLISQYKAIGWHSSSRQQIQLLHKDVSFFQSKRAKYHLKLGERNSKTQMKHFRSQINF